MKINNSKSPKPQPIEDSEDLEYVEEMTFSNGAVYKGNLHQ